MDLSQIKTNIIKNENFKIYRFESGYFDTMNIDHKFIYNKEPEFPHILRTNKIHYVNKSHNCISVEHPSPSPDLSYYKNKNITYVIITEEKENYTDKFYKIDKDIIEMSITKQLIKELCTEEIDDNFKLHSEKYVIVIRS
jgi:hypothetical protein